MKKATVKICLSAWVGKVAFWFISAAFIMWGWNTVAPHLNAPLFNYWEIFAIRMALSHIMYILWCRPEKSKNGG